MAKAVFTADQLESMLSPVLTTVIEKLDACMEKMLEKFESRLDRMYGANRLAVLTAVRSALLTEVLMFGTV